MEVMLAGMVARGTLKSNKIIWGGGGDFIKFQTEEHRSEKRARERGHIN